MQGQEGPLITRSSEYTAKVVQSTIVAVCSGTMPQMGVTKTWKDVILKYINVAV